MTTKGHDGAVQRLQAGLFEQDRLRERYGAALGTSSELGAYVRLRAAGVEVAARGAGIHSGLRRDKSTRKGAQGT